MPPRSKPLETGFSLILLSLTCAAASAAESATQHVNVYREPGRFGGWPANHGIWSWGDEILVGFSAGYHKDNGPRRHSIDHDRPEEHLLARSLDGGETWTIENPSEHGALIPVGPALHGVTPPGLVEKPWRDCPGGVDLSDPNFIITFRMTDANAGPARFYYSTDRGHRWQGPFRLPMFDRQGIAARTEYIIDGKHAMLVFLTSPKDDGEEGRPFVIRTTDGAKSWQFVSWIGPEPAGFGIMPSAVRLSPTELVAAVRRREESGRWIDLYRSVDNAASWSIDRRVVPSAGEGNPPHMIPLADGRLCLTYGHRAAPFGIRALVSDDGGQTWSDEHTIRADPDTGRDLGYTRNVQRADGKVVTVYYYNMHPESERFIAATIWDPDKIGAD